MPDLKIVDILSAKQNNQTIEIDAFILRESSRKHCGHSLRDCSTEDVSHFLSGCETPAVKMAVFLSGDTSTKDGECIVV